MAHSLESRIKAKAHELGFSLVGIAPPDGSRHTAFYRAWLERGAHGDMAYLERPDAVARRADLKRTLPSVRSVVVVAQEYLTDDAEESAADPGMGLIARYARGRDYHKVVETRLRGLLVWLREREGVGAEARAYVDTGPILERELAQRAGLGWFGKNTMLIHPRRGSWFFLGCLLLDVELATDAPIAEDHCGTCSRCLDACPTGALLGRDETGAPRIDARRCISYLTIEHKGSIPRELRPLLGNRVFGCDICQDVCPFNRKFAKPANEPAFAARGPGEGPHPGTASPSLTDLMATALDPERWDAFTRGSAIRRAGRAGLARNVVVALGNWGAAEAVPSLAEALRDREPLVREHAAWALARIRAPEAARVLAAHRVLETDERVRTEME